MRTLPRGRRWAAATGALVMLALSIASCAPSVSRSGYEPKSPDATGCWVAVKRAAVVEPDQVDVLGEIAIGDTGFSSDCDEKTVIALLRKEGCSAGAHIVNIVEERRQDVASTCYRVRARLLRLRNPSSLPVDDARFSDSAVQSRSDLDNRRTNSILWGAVIAGVVGGLAAGLGVALLR
ncbi:MAG TPA: hypothetical protein VM580_32150 [Labilithrix sp.]|nr:hypothetical protein [Labilithrix sp.]